MFKDVAVRVPDPRSNDLATYYARPSSACKDVGLILKDLLMKSTLPWPAQHHSKMVKVCTASRLALLTFAVALLTGLSPLKAAPAHKTENVIFVMTDGLRWQEIFHGADSLLMTKEAGEVENTVALKSKYWSGDEEERRRKLLPFIWSTVAAQGQIYGNRDKQSEASVTNGFNFSYPGYSEALCGFPDARLVSNDKVLNPNATVLEWLNHQPAFQGKVAAFGAWDVFPFIFNAPRAGFPVNAGYDPFTLLPQSKTVALVNQLKKDQPVVWDEEPFDALPFYTALEYLKTAKPRVLYVSLGETDDWAHMGKYDLYLDAAHRADQYLKTLWETVQAIPEYQGKTTLVFGTDHGRGLGPEWKTHGQKVPASKYVWMMFLGPDTRSLGERKAIGTVTESQIAATVAGLLGQDYKAAVPASGEPIADVLH